jgi:hypothetical protein
MKVEERTHAWWRLGEGRREHHKPESECLQRRRVKRTRWQLLRVKTTTMGLTQGKNLVSCCLREAARRESYPTCASL